MTDETVLHVLTTISRKGGGVSEAARLLVLSLSRKRPGAISVLATRDSGTDEDIEGWKSVPITLCRAYPPRNLSFAPTLLFELLRRRPSVLHLHGLWTFHCVAALVWSWVTRGRLIITVHGMLEPWILGRSRKLKWVFRRLFLDRLIARADRLHVLTEKERADVARVYPAAVTTIIPNFVAPEAGGDGARPTWWEPELAGRRIFLFLGRLHEKKGCRELLEAWESVSTTNPGFRDSSELVFCGWPDGDDGFLAQVADARARVGNVRYVGPQFGAEKWRAYGAATVFVLPSKSEGLPMTVLEAWQVGLIVIMTPECNLPVGFDQGAALRTGPSSRQIAQSLMEADRLSDIQRRAMTAAGKRIVQQFFSEETVTRAMLGLYADIRAGGRHRGLSVSPAGRAPAASNRAFPQ